MSTFENAPKPRGDDPIGVLLGKLRQRDAYVMQLEDALEAATHGIEFLHGCLAEPDRYRYAYPHQTLEGLAKMRAILPPRPPLCVHSIRRPDDCESCSWQFERSMQRIALGLGAHWGDRD